MPLSKGNNNSLGFFYKYKTISVDHLKELQEDIDKLYHEGKLSENKTYRQYLSTKKFVIPESFPNAKSIIVLAIATKLVLVNFQLDGKKHEIMIPPQYYDDGLTFEDLENLILKKLIKKPGFKIELAKGLHLKLLAVRSGLGNYGRNNLCYVDEMGSLITLYAYFTDFQFQEDNWREIKMMNICEHCNTCTSNCPSNAITTLPEVNFVIDAGRCITLYNEIEGEFPKWISPDAHNALKGCMKCQLSCPANREAIKLIERFEDITEEETRMILEGKPKEELLNSLAEKLKMFYPSNANEAFPILKRNLEVLIR